MKRAVIIAGGGTGGHIYPGIAIARALKKHPDLEVHFVGAVGGLEEKIVPRENFPLHLIPVGKLHRSVGLGVRLKTLLKMPWALWVSARILKRLRPVSVLGVGGFASGPILFVASLLGYRSLIWEPNAHPGMANRLLAPFVDEGLLVFQEAAAHLKTKRNTRAGLPVRDSMVPQTRERHQTLRVLVFGGSQGARAINETVMRSVLRGGSWLEGVELVHQTGPSDFARVSEAYKNASPKVQVHEYLHDMDQRYAWADLIFCRAGASTVAEVAACQKAVVFVPLPTAADNHQQRNAEVLVRQGAAQMVLQKDFTPERFQSMVQDFKQNPDVIRTLETNIKKFQFPGAADKIVERLVGERP